MSTNMDGNLAVEDKDAAQTAAPDEGGHGDAPGPEKSLGDATDDSSSCDTATLKGLHELGVAVDLPLSDTDDIRFDVIAVHGLHGQSRTTWEAEYPFIPGMAWLPEAFSGPFLKPARVILYGYDSNEDLGRCYTSQGVYQEAETLLDNLLRLRTPDIVSVRRPIYFLSHDVGGLVVKAALVLARSKPEKYSDIVDSTRAMIFFGYPHSPCTPMELQEQLFRLLSLRINSYRDGHIPRLVKSLAETISEVNDAFVHTRMVTQALLVNILSTHEDAAQRVFDTSTAVWGSPFEHRLKVEVPHLDLTKSSGTVGDWPLARLPDSDWLSGGLSNELFRILGDVVYRASPVYPSLECEPVADNGELDALLNTSSSRILHMQCSSDAGRASEMVRNYLDINKAHHRMLLYFQFNRHDVRFNNMQAMLSTFVAQIAYDQLETMTSSIATMAREYNATKARTTEDMFYHWDFLRGDSLVVEGLHVLGCLDECDDSALWFLSQFQRLTEKAKAESAMRVVIVTTKGTPRDHLIVDALSKFPRDLVAHMDYTPPSPVSLPAGFELSMLAQEDTRYATNDLQDVVENLILGCENDERLCRLLIELLKSKHDYPNSVPPLLLTFSTTHDPELIFESILAQMPEERQPWAQKLLSWVLLSFRPLRSSEFCRVAELCLRGEDKTGNGVGGMKVSTILQSFTGMLTVIDGEVKFSHPAIRTWLDPDMECTVESGASKAWYRNITARTRHLDIVQTCLEHLLDDSPSTENWASQLPYATQFWTSHYKQAGPVDGILESIFESQPTLQRWVSACTPSLDEESHTPLAVAAHFGLDDIISCLLAKPGVQNDIAARGRALVEAARMGELPALRLILESYPSGLGFDDIYLHEAVKAASSSETRETFRELVDHIPKPPHPIPQPRRNERALSVEIPHDASKTEGFDDRGDEDKPEESPNRGTKQLPQLSKADDPFLWLADVLFRACCVGEDEIVHKLLALGATPNPPQNLFHRRNTPLHAAAIRCQFSTAKILVAAGASLTATNDLRRTPLHSTAAYGSHEIITLLLDHGAVIDVADEAGWTPLEIACAWGKLAAAEAILQHKAFQECARIDWQGSPVAMAADLGYYGLAEAFLRHGFDPNIPGADGATALWHAVRTNRLDICRLLLENKAGPDVTPDRSTSPLIEAVHAENLDTIKLLVEYGADIDKKESMDQSWERTPLNIAACHNKTDIVRYLLSKNADPHATDREGWTAIWSAARFGHEEVVRMLAEVKADVNCICSDLKWTPLYAAVEYPDTIRTLLEYGGDLNIESGSSDTPLDCAITMGHLETIRLILDWPGNKPDLTRASTQEALHEAAYRSYTEVVSLVLETGGDVNSVDRTNEPLLSAAMRQDAEPMVRTILEYRPDVDIKNTNESTVLHCITSFTPVESVRLVVNAGAKLDMINNNKSTPLMIAISEGNTEVVRYLLSKTATADTLNMAALRDKATPLHLACQRSNVEIVQLLLEHGSDPNFDCMGWYGTPLMAATLRTIDDPEDEEDEKQQIIELLLEKGAAPTISSGDFMHPIISASLACSVKQVELLFSSGVFSNDTHDSFVRKAVHLACYNSLEVLNVLDVPDSDFAATDIVGRVPLHYAALSGEVDLVKEVLARSERVGIGIDVQDKDGWTPLLWAARTSRIDTWQRRRNPLHSEVISFLISKGADTRTTAHGSFQDWTAVEIARYHRADEIAGLISAQGSPTKSSSTRRIRRGEVSQSTCSYCLLNMCGVYFSCTVCVNDMGLCFKCYGSKAILHPEHDLKEDGYEWEEDDAASNPPESINDQELDHGQDQQDFPGDFDDEIVGDDDGSIEAEMEGSVTAGGENTTAVLPMTTRPVGSIKTRIGAHR